MTPLHLACGEGYLKVVNVLLNHEADVGMKAGKFNALDLAIENGHE